MEIKINKPDIMQVFDCYEDRVYLKINKGFIFSSTTTVRVDRLKDWKRWNIECSELPDELYINGSRYKLTKE